VIGAFECPICRRFVRFIVSRGWSAVQIALSDAKLFTGSVAFVN
jgi:hypothetical protein